MVHQVEAKKLMYATTAHQLANKLYNTIKTALGKKQRRRLKKPLFVAKNCGDTGMKALRWDLPYQLGNYNAIENAAGTKFPMNKDWLGVDATVSLSEGERTVFKPVWCDVFEELKPMLDMTENKNMTVLKACGFNVTVDNALGGIVSIITDNSCELVNGKEPIFRPIYEITPERNMVLLRHNEQTERTYGKLINIRCAHNSAICSTIYLDYELADNKTSVALNFHKGINRIDVKFIIEKSLHHQSENVYLLLPIVKDDKALWMDKTACLIRSGIDQLPRACMDFFSIQNGVASIGENGYTAVAMPDTALIWLGDLNDTEATEMNADTAYENNHDPFYAWVLNNFWTTNFKATTAGFYEFDFVLTADMTEDTYPEEVFRNIRSSIAPQIIFLTENEA